MTKPQIDLMLHDQPMVDYKTKKDKKKKGAKIDYSDKSIRDRAEAALARLKEQEDAGMAGLGSFEIEGGISIKL